MMKASRALPMLGATRKSRICIYLCDEGLFVLRAAELLHPRHLSGGGQLVDERLYIERNNGTRSVSRTDVIVLPSDERAF